MKEIQVNANEAGQRLDKLLQKILSKGTKSFLYKMLRKKNIKLNEKKAQGNEILQIGDRVQIYLADETFAKFSGETEAKIEQWPRLPKDFQVVFENEDLVIMNKPAGMLSQKAKDDDISMNEYLISYALEKQYITKADLKTFRPSVCNRLDRNTTGLLIGGISLKGLQVMSKALKDRNLAKYYVAIVLGSIEKPQKLQGYLYKDEKTNQVTILKEKTNQVTILKEKTKDASYVETAYEPIWSNGEITVLRIHLITGKPHQIRAHLASIAHPIVGDSKYGDAKFNQWAKKELGIKGQLLHAKELHFPDDFPITKLQDKIVTVNEPEPFQRFLQYMKNK